MGCNRLDMVNQSLRDIGVGIKHLDIGEMQTVDKLRKPFEGKNLITVFHTIHTRIGHVWHIQPDWGVLPIIGSDMMNKVPEQHTLMVAIILPVNLVSIVSCVKPQRASFVRERCRGELFAIYRKHLSPPSSPR